jgi:hypothetical protein
LRNLATNSRRTQMFRRARRLRRLFGSRTSSRHRWRKAPLRDRRSIESTTLKSSVKLTAPPTPLSAVRSRLRVCTSSNGGMFSMAITARSTKVCSSSICLSVTIPTQGTHSSRIAYRRGGSFAARGLHGRPRFHASGLEWLARQGRAPECARGAKRYGARRGLFAGSQCHLSHRARR